jgi:hypothetical protein
MRFASMGRTGGLTGRFTCSWYAAEAETKLRWSYDANAPFEQSGGR